MSQIKVFRTAGASYLALASSVVTALLTIRIATQSLSAEEFGLWSFTIQSVGYFLLFDFGVSNSLSRIFGEPLARGDKNEIGRWLLMCIGVLAAQGAIILAAGCLLRDSIISWFGIPPHLQTEARHLWTWFLAVQAIGMPLRVFSGLLFAENRAYWMHAISIINAWVVLAVFFVSINYGGGVSAYAYGAAAGTLASGLIGFLLIYFGPSRFKLCVKGIELAHIRELFYFSGGVFAISIGIQVTMASQALVVTKLLGLAAGGVFAVTYRLPNTICSMAWKPFDAFVPRWQVMICSGDNTKLGKEFSTIWRLTLLLVSVAMIFSYLCNPGFVAWWAKPEFFGGDALNVGIVLLLIVQTVTHCFGTLVVLSKKLRGYVISTLIGAVLSVIFMVSGATKFGLAAIPIALLLAEFFTNSSYAVLFVKKFLSLGIREFFINDAIVILACAATAYLARMLMTNFTPNYAPFNQLILGTLSAGMISIPLGLKIYKLSAATIRK